MIIRQLEIKNYRGIESLVWQPGPGINCLIGPGDAGKTTVLYAIALLLSTRPSISVCLVRDFSKNHREYEHTLRRGTQLDGNGEHNWC